MNRFIVLLWLPLLVVSFQSHPRQQNQPTRQSMELFADRRQVLLSSSLFVALNSAATWIASPASAASTATIAATPTSTTAMVVGVPTPPFTPDVSWPLGKVAYSLLPLAGTSTRRATVQEEIVKDTIWTFDQIQGIVNVNVPVRQTVVALSPEAGGGLWVHNPVAPTPQLRRMMQTLVATYGPVRAYCIGDCGIGTQGNVSGHSHNYTPMQRCGFNQDSGVSH
jgi:hypothetical protein